MHDGATALRQSNGEAVHVSEPGVILDPAGEVVTSENPTLMNRLDAKVKEPMTLSKGTIALAVAIFVLLQVIFNYGSSFVSWARDDQTQKEQIQTIKTQGIETRADVQKMSDRLEEIQKAMQARDLKEAEKRGYELKAAEGDHGKK